MSNWTPSTISDLTGSGLNQSAAFRTDCVGLLSQKMNIDDIWRICSQASLEFHIHFANSLRNQINSGDHGRKLRPNFALLLPVKFRGGVNEMSEWIFRVIHGTQRLDIFLTVAGRSAVWNSRGAMAKKNSNSLEGLRRTRQHSKQHLYSKQSTEQFDTGSLFVWSYQGVEQN